MSVLFFWSLTDISLFVLPITGAIACSRLRIQDSEPIVYCQSGGAVLLPASGAGGSVVLINFSLNYQDTLLTYLIYKWTFIVRSMLGFGSDLKVTNVTEF
eukprot:scaffold304381_cov139-Cyclotella_meneghiniana.AAC.1